MALWPHGCSNLLCLPPPVVDYIYFGILLIANTLNCLIAIASMYLVAKLRLPWCCPKRQQMPSQEPPPPISIVVPCYLPNEQTITESTIDHIMRRLEWPGALTLFVVYNTPVPLPFEERLKRLDGRDYAPGRVLRVIHARGSTSKAENLNVVLQQHVSDEFVAFYGVCRSWAPSPSLSPDATLPTLPARRSRPR